MIFIKYLMASNIIEVSPLPEGTTVPEIREIFSAYSLDRVQIHKGAAYLLFTYPSEVETLDFTFEDFKVGQLNNALINPIMGEFTWPDPQLPPKTNIQYPEVPTHVQEQQSDPLHSKPQFIIVKECDNSHLQQCDQNFIKNNIFGQFNIGKVAKLDRDVYVQLLQGNQTESLKNKFKDDFVLELGPTAKIDMADQNFILDAIEQKIQIRKQEEKKRKIEEEERKDEEILKKKLAMEELQKKRELEQLAKMKQRQEISKINDINGSDKMEWTVRPEGKCSSPKSKPMSMLWFGITITWALFIIFS